MSTIDGHDAPQFDAELGEVLIALRELMPPTIIPDLIIPMRSGRITPTIEELLAGRRIEHSERTIPGPQGAPDLLISIFQKLDHVAGSPGIYHLHGGGMIFGDRFTGIDVILDLVEKMDAVAVFVEYRLARRTPIQIIGKGVWDRQSNDTGWDAYLGERRFTDGVPISAAPARATDLSGLPPTFVDCGSAGVFRDEDVAQATAIWASGGDWELHVWPGGFHGFDLLAPQSALATGRRETGTRWVRRLLGV